MLGIILTGMNGMTGIVGNLVMGAYYGGYRYGYGYGGG